MYNPWTFETAATRLGKPDGVTSPGLEIYNLIFEYGEEGAIIGAAPIIHDQVVAARDNIRCTTLDTIDGCPTGDRLDGVQFADPVGEHDQLVVQSSSRTWKA